MALAVPEDGDGRSAGSRRQFVVIVSDGMQFEWGNIATGPIPQAKCEELKARGAEIATIHIRYAPMPEDGSYQYWVAPVIEQPGPALAACASPGYFFEADSTQQIHDAFAELASRLMTQLRIAS